MRAPKCSGQSDEIHYLGAQSESQFSGFCLSCDSKSETWVVFSGVVVGSGVGGVNFCRVF